ncbi:hypothetical protein XENORESO_015178 [Xenotaenia resolanae]|uniref:Uncharacterized protein n=1 Tax=Xenotaenia resolanae TaxID=208358 RepID=A0ABV0WIW7_9TELE
MCVPLKSQTSTLQSPAKHCVRISKCLFALCFQCVFISQASSVCVHVVIGCLGSSSQRGRWVGFRAGFLFSALIEEHVRCFSLQQDDRVRVTLHQGHLTLQTESQEGK